MDKAIKGFDLDGTQYSIIGFILHTGGQVHEGHFYGYGHSCIRFCNQFAVKLDDETTKVYDSSTTFKSLLDKEKKEVAALIYARSDVAEELLLDAQEKPPEILPTKKHKQKSTGAAKSAALAEAATTTTAASGQVRSCLWCNMTGHTKSRCRSSDVCDSCHKSKKEGHEKTCKKFLSFFKQEGGGSFDGDGDGGDDYEDDNPKGHKRRRISSSLWQSSSSSRNDDNISGGEQGGGSGSGGNSSSTSSSLNQGSKEMFEFLFLSLSASLAPSLDFLSTCASTLRNHSESILAVSITARDASVTRRNKVCDAWRAFECKTQLALKQGVFLPPEPPRAPTKADLVWLFECNGFESQEIEFILSALRAALAVDSSIVFSGSACIAAARLSSRINFGDIDISYISLRKVVNKRYTTRDKIIAALEKVVKGALGSALAVKSTLVHNDQYNIEGSPPPLGSSNHANSSAFTLFFPFTQHKIEFQMSAREEGWTPCDYVQNFWSSHMGAYVIVENGNFVGKLTPETKNFASTHFAHVQPRCILSAFAKDFEPPVEGGATDAAAHILINFLNVIATLTTRVTSRLMIKINEQSQSYLAKRVKPAFRKTPQDNWDTGVQNERDEQYKELSMLIPALATKAQKELLKRLRGLTWRFARDAHAGGIIFDARSSAIAIAHYLRSAECPLLFLNRPLKWGNNVEFATEIERLAPSLPPRYKKLSVAAVAWLPRAFDSSRKPRVHHHAPPLDEFTSNENKIDKMLIEMMPFGVPKSTKRHLVLNSYKLENAVRMLVNSFTGAYLTRMPHLRSGIIEAFLAGTHFKRLTTDEVFIRLQSHLITVAKSSTSQVSAAVIRAVARGEHIPHSTRDDVAKNLHDALVYAANKAFGVRVVFVYDVFSTQAALDTSRNLDIGQQHDIIIFYAGGSRYGSIFCPKRARAERYKLSLAERHADTAEKQAVKAVIDAAAKAAKEPRKRVNKRARHATDAEKEKDLAEKTKREGEKSEKRIAAAKKAKLKPTKALVETWRTAVIKRHLASLIIGSDEQQAHVKRTIMNHVNALSQEMSLASVLINLTLLLACHGMVEWPIIKLGAGATGAIANVAKLLFTDALKGGRSGSDSQAGAAAEAASRPVYPTIAFLRETFGVIPRSDRIHGDTYVLDSAAIQMRSAANRYWGASLRFGLPRRIKGQIKQELLRLIENELKKPDTDLLLWRWRATSIVLNACVIALRNAIIGLTHVRTDTGELKCIPIYSHIRAFLQEPSVVSLITKHTSWLWNGNDIVFNSTSGYWAPVPAVENETLEDANVLDDQPNYQQVNAAKLVIRQRKEQIREAKQKLAEAGNIQGTAAEFALKLNVRPHYGIYYTFRALADREKWIQEAKSEGFFIPLPTQDDLVREHRPPPNAVLNNDDDAGCDDDDDIYIDEALACATNIENDVIGDAEDEDEEEIDVATTVHARLRATRPYYRRSGYLLSCCNLSPISKLERTHAAFSESNISRGIFDTDTFKFTGINDIIDPKLGKNQRLGKSFVTNGHAISILIEKRGPTRPAVQADSGRTHASAEKARVNIAGSALLKEALKFIAIDPGGTNPLSSRFVIVDKSGNVREVLRTLKGDEFRADSGQPQRTQRSIKWLRDVGFYNPGGVHESLSSVSSKTASIDNFMAFFKVFLNTRTQVFSEKMKTRWAIKDFESYRQGKRTLGRYCGRLAAGRLVDGDLGVPPTFVYGDANYELGFKGTKPSPKTACKNACDAVAAGVSRRGVKGACVLATEYGSSSYHSVCGTQLRHVYIAKGFSRRERIKKASGKGTTYVGSKWKECRGLHLCGNPLCPEPHRRLVDRDKDAPRSIEDGAIARAIGELLPPYMIQSFQKKTEPPRFYLQPAVEPFLTLPYKI